MEYIFTPAKQPPVLNRFSHLSDDAQKVLAAIHKQYQQQKEKMLMSQKTHEQSSRGPSTYYQSMYRARFGSVSTQQCPGPSPSVSLTRTPLTDLEKLQKTNLPMHDISKHVPNIELSTSSRNNNVYTNVPKATDSGDSNNTVTDPFNQCDNEVCPLENYLNETGDGSFSISLESNPLSLGSPILFPSLEHEEQDLSLLNDEKNTVKNAKDSEAFHLGRQSCTKSSFGQEMTSSVGSDMQKYFLNDKNDEKKTRPDNFEKISSAKECSVVTDITTVVSPSLNAVVQTNLEKEKVKSQDCAISRRLKEHQQLRKNMVVTESTVTDKVEKDLTNQNVKRKIPAFFAPFKKPKPTNDNHGTIPLPTEDCLVNVLTLNTDDRESLFNKIKETKEVLLTLVYKDAGNQLRDNYNKKKQQNQKQRTVDQVTFVVFSLHGTSKDTAASKTIMTLYSIPVDVPQDHLPWVRSLLETLLKSTSRKICLGAKELFVLLFKKRYINSKVGDWSVLDPLIAGWLLDPDNPPSSFEDCLKSVNLSQNKKEGVDSSELLKSDLPLLSSLMERLYQKLQNRELWDLFCCVETKLVPLLAHMECQQVQIDTEKLLMFSDALKKKLQKLEQKAYECVGHSFLISSPAQLRQVLFEELKLDTKLPQKNKLTKTSVGHQISTSEAVLQQLVDIHPLPGLVLEYRQFQKMKSTYMDGIMNSVEQNMLSTHWDQMSAVTGRLSSYQPNVQGIPKAPILLTNYKDNFIVDKEHNDTLEIYARDIFRSQDSWSFVAADFQQIELRLLSHLADDEILLQIFRKQSDTDIFIELTSQWLGKPVSSITSADREQTKRIVYSVMYGAGKEKLAEYLKISADNAKAIINSFLVKFPAVNDFSKKCVEFCQRHGYTSTIFKRKRMIPNIKHPSPPLRAQAERQAVNFCVQGSAADLCKAAMLQIEQSLRNHHHLRARQLFQIHDEILLEVHDDDVKAVTSILKSVMEDSNTLCGSVVNLRVPIKVSVSVGKTWGHMHLTKLET